MHPSNRPAVPVHLRSVLKRPPTVQARRVRVTNNLDVSFTDRYDGVLVTIAPNESETVPIDMATHFFGPTFEIEEMLRYVSKRQGWNTPRYLELDEAGQTLAEQLFARLKIEPLEDSADEEAGCFYCRD
jgi:hypothetical protein